MSDKTSATSAPANSRAEGEGVESNATLKQSNWTNTQHNKAGQMVNVVITFLDESKTVFQISQKALGKNLFYQVCDSLNLVEVDYFGLEYFDSNRVQYWLDLEKQICKQMSLPVHSLAMNFAVKFYTVEPSKLEDELTRYLFALQIKRDLSDGSLVCSESITALLAAYIIQAECGDYNIEEYSNHLYISKFKLLPHQDEEFETKVMENHKKLIGLSPADADLQLLELANQLEMYGIKLSPVKDHEGVPLNLAVIHNGILIFQNYTKVNTFDWVKIRKLSFKRKHFFIKLHQEEFFGDVLEFVFQHRNECKNFWKKCIEQHSFFKCFEIKRKTRHKMRIFSRGSSFRYAGRTQQQISDYVKSNSNSRKQKPFQRSNSMKFCSLKEDDGLGYSSDLNESTKGGSCGGGENGDSLSYVTSCATMRQLHKSCDTIDQQSVCLTSVLSPDESGSVMHSISDGLHQLNLSVVDMQSTMKFRSFKRLMNQEYYVFRDLVMSERTYLKDLELMRNWFKNDVSKEPSRSSEMLSLLLSVCEPLIDCHKAFLLEIEYLLYIWDKDGFDSLPPLSTVLANILKWLPHYEQLIERLPFILEQINSNFCLNKEFERVCREFEAKRELIDCYCANHFDYLHMKRLFEQLNNFNTEYENTLDSLINMVILIELQRDITGFDNIVQSGRRFVRDGCLLKLSKKGFQQRLFFLFSDVLIYASRSISMNFQFKIHGYFSLYNVFAEETDSKCGVEHCFTIYAGDKILILAALSECDRQAWLHDIKQTAHTQTQKRILQPSITSNDMLDQIDHALNEHWKNFSNDTSGLTIEFEQMDKLQLRTNTIVHVCWQRACSISAADYRYALTVSFSGYLLRKFKNCSGWQKLWVEFTHFCLFFYKSSEDEFPLASLPVIGYTVSVPLDSDNMSKNYVFKLQFKAHIYFFRAESEYAFNKWMEVIKQSTSDDTNCPPVQ